MLHSHVITVPEGDAGFPVLGSALLMVHGVSFISPLFGSLLRHEKKADNITIYMSKSEKQSERCGDALPQRITVTHYIIAHLQPCRDCDTSTITWFHPNHGMVSSRIYRHTIYVDHSIPTLAHPD